MPQQLLPFFSYQAPGRIWQIATDLETSCLGIEVRDALQEASFSYVCPQQDKVILEGLVLENTLLSNLIACHKSVMLFQQFDDLENPADITTLALDVHSQEVLWAVGQYRHMIFYGEESLGKAGVASGEEAWSAIHLRNGLIRDVDENEAVAIFGADRLENVHNHTLVLPTSYEAGEAHFATAHEFIQLYLQLVSVKSCEYLHVFDKIVISFYTAEGEKLANRIAVFDAEGNLILHQIMAKELPKPGSETFMVWHQHLFYIENSSCLKGYNLQ